MFGNLFGPKHTLKDALILLEKGLRSGEITLQEGTDAPRTPVVERARFHQSLQVQVSAPRASYLNVRWSNTVPSGAF